jgi:hypothetical protein
MKRFDKEWEQQLASGRPSLPLAFWRLFLWRWLFTGFLWGLTNALALSAPLVIQALLRWYAQDDAVPSTGYLLAGLLFITQLLSSAICLNQLVLMLYVLGMNMRSICNALVYRKSLRLSTGTRQVGAFGCPRATFLPLFYLFLFFWRHPWPSVWLRIPHR